MERADYFDLNAPSASRFLRNFSSFGELETSEDQEVLACLDYVVDFVRGEYLNVLESAGYHIIYQHDSRWQQIGTLEEIEMATEYDDAEWSRYEADESKLVSKTAAWRHIIQNSDIGVYDQITALSEASINGHFRSSATAGSTLSEWTFESYFNAKFEPPTIRLMADKGTAIIFIHLKSGTLRHLRNFQLHSEYVSLSIATPCLYTYRAQVGKSSISRAGGLHSKCHSRWPTIPIWHRKTANGFQASRSRLSPRSMRARR